GDVLLRSRATCAESRASVASKSRYLPTRIMNNRSLPPATLIPALPYADVRAGVDWLCRAFGFRERMRIAGHRSQLCVGAGALVIAQGTDPPAPSSKPAPSTMVRGSAIRLPGGGA